MACSRVKGFVLFSLCVFIGREVWRWRLESEFRNYTPKLPYILIQIKTTALVRGL
jgi:hypothetical protein